VPNGSVFKGLPQEGKKGAQGVRWVCRPQPADKTMVVTTEGQKKGRKGGGGQERSKFGPVGHLGSKKRPWSEAGGGWVHPDQTQPRP